MEKILETMQDDGRFNRFLKAIYTTNYQDILDGTGPFTVFAPVDDAFQNLPDDVWEDLLLDKSKLADLISAHVVIGKCTSTDLEESDEIKNMNNMTLAVEKHNEGIIVGGAKIVGPDIFCQNGIIHAIDVVLS